MNRELRALRFAVLALLVIAAGCGRFHATRTVAGGNDYRNEPGSSGSTTSFSYSRSYLADQVEFTPASGAAKYESKGEDCAIEVRQACTEEPRWIRAGLGKVVDRQDFELADGLAYLGEMTVHRCGMPSPGKYYTAEAEKLAKHGACKLGADMVVYAGCKCALTSGQDERIGGLQDHSPASQPVYMWRVYKVER